MAHSTASDPVVEVRGEDARDGFHRPQALLGRIAVVMPQPGVKLRPDGRPDGGVGVPRIGQHDGGAEVEPPVAAAVVHVAALGSRPHHRRHAAHGARLRGLKLPDDPLRVGMRYLGDDPPVRSLDRRHRSPLHLSHSLFTIVVSPTMASRRLRPPAVRWCRWGFFDRINRDYAGSRALSSREGEGRGRRGDAEAENHYPSDHRSDRTRTCGLTSWQAY